MGLLLSVLVACVGVVELFAFYENVTRNLKTPSSQSNLSELSDRYVEGLEHHKRYLENQIAIRRSDLSSEDIDVEFTLVPEVRRRSPSPRKFLLTENRVSRSPSPRRFLATDVGEGTSERLPQYRVEEKRFFTIKNENDSNDSIFPLPKQFVVTEQEVDEEVEFRRSPSPYPPLILEVPRNSICKELLEHTSDVFAEVDEDAISRTSSSEKLQSILESKHDSNEYWRNKVLIVPQTSPGVSKSSDSSVVESLLDTSKSYESDNETNNFDDQFLDSLDGVKKKKLSRNSSLRRSRREKTANVYFSDDVKDDRLSSSSMQNNDAQTAKILTEAANVLKNVNQETGGSPQSSPGLSNGKDSKTSEPFWVNR